MKLDNNLEFLAVKWYVGTGVVLCLDAVTKEKKAYIGGISGHNEDFDIKKTVEYGSKFEIDAAKALFPEHFETDIDEYYVLREYSHTDKQQLWKVLSRPIKGLYQADFQKRFEEGENPKHKHFLVKKI